MNSKNINYLIIYNIIDLAGSERVKITGARGKRLEESKKINQSLSALGNVIFCLIKKMKDKQAHIPYRNSKLTRLLEDSLGGNCITTFMGMISPGQDNFSESFSTLKFANRTKKIKNKPKINEELDQELLIRKYEEELTRLRKIMLDKKKIMGNSKLLQLEEEKERAEKDKNIMMRKLQEQSQKFLEEREEKKKLQMKINHLKSQVEVYKKLKKGFHMEDWREQEVEDMKGIENQLLELEKQKGHVVEYKDLLRRQRDIMVALTSKLNERDEAIVQLQDELEAYDKIYFECELLMSTKNAQMDYLRDKLKDQGIIMDTLLEGFQEEHINSAKNDKHERYSQRYSGIETKEDLIQENLKNIVFNEIGGIKDKENIGIGQMKNKIDMIVDELASKRKGEALETVAKDLLGLQNMISSLWEKKIQENTVKDDKYILNKPTDTEPKTQELMYRYSEKIVNEEVDMKKINYDSLFQKDKLIRKQTEEDVLKQFKESPKKAKEKTYENIISKFEEIKSSILDFSKSSNTHVMDKDVENIQYNKLKKKNTKVLKSSRLESNKTRRPKSQVLRESKTRVENVQKRRKSSKIKNSISQSKVRNKSFSSKYTMEPKSAKKRLNSKKGSFLSRKSGGFNEVNSKLQSILNNGKKKGYLDNKYSLRGDATEKRVEGLLRENNILNMMPKVSNLK